MKDRISPEANEKYLGLSTLECVRIVVAQNPQIAAIYFRGYNYIPNKTTKDDELVYAIGRNELLTGDIIRKIVEQLPEGWNLAADSKVILQNGKIAHLPMIDLSPGKSDESKERIVSRLNEIITPIIGGGFLLETERSYHFLGSRVLTIEEWFQFLGYSLITSIVTKTPDDQPNIHEVIADYRYIGHALIRGSTGLRVTANGEKTVAPKVVAVL